MMALVAVSAVLAVSVVSVVLVVVLVATQCIAATHSTPLPPPACNVHSNKEGRQWAQHCSKGHQLCVFTLSACPCVVLVGWGKHPLASTIPVLTCYLFMGGGVGGVPPAAHTGARAAQGGQGGGAYLGGAPWVPWCHTTPPKKWGGAVGCPLCHLAHPKHFWCFPPCIPPTPHAAWGCTAHPQRGWVGGMWHHSPPTGCVGVGGAWGAISLAPHTLFGTPLQKVRNSELFPY